MKIKELIRNIEILFPISIQEDYDNSGSQVIFDDDELETVMISLDIDEDVISEAIEKSCSLIISHHPFFFKPLDKIVASDPKSKLILRLIENRISLYSLHTNLDKIYYGKLAEILGFKDLEIIFKSNCDDGLTVNRKDDIGYGVISGLERKIRLEKFLKKIKDTLNIDFIIYSGELDDNISNVAILNGAGGSSIEKIIGSYNVDCILTGDVGYHHAKYAGLSSIPVIDAGHFGTEKILLDFLKNQLQEFLTKKLNINHIKIYISENEKNPFKMFV